MLIKQGGEYYYSSHRNPSGLDYQPVFLYRWCENKMECTLPRYIVVTQFMTIF